MKQTLLRAESADAVQRLKLIGLSKRSAAILAAEKQKRGFLSEFSSESLFSDDVWVIDKKEKEMNFPRSVRTLVFSALPEGAKNDCKNWVLGQLLCGRKIKGIKSSLCSIASCLRIVGCIDGIGTITEKDILKIHDNLMDGSRETVTAVRRWNTLRRFFDSMKCQHQTKIMAGYVLPEITHRKKSDKYIPDEAADILDRMYRGDEIPLAYRVIYWCMRLYPNRIEEIVSMKKDCLKQVTDDKFLLKIPVSKTAGNVNKPSYKGHVIVYEGVGKFFVDLLKMQIEQAEKLLPDTEFLFVSRRVYYKKNIDTKEYGYEEVGNKAYLLHEKTVQTFWYRFSKRLDLRDNDGDFISITTHKFRHNASTDRLISGVFSSLDVMHETGHKNTAMIEENYYHAPKPEKKAPAFRGLITDNVRREKEVLGRPYAMSIPGLGICSDHRDCSGNLKKCLICEDVRIDPAKLDFMRHEYDKWKVKLEKVTKIGNESYARVCREWISAYEQVFNRYEKGKK